jgi:hypothetical protein
MATTTIQIALSRDKTEYLRGEVLSGSVTVYSASLDEPRRSELSVLWYTEGIGDEDLGIVHFQLLGEDATVLGTHTYPFEVTLPVVPLTYHGRLVKIHWVVRVRVQHAAAPDTVQDMPFIVL